MQPAELEHQAQEGNIHLYGSYKPAQLVKKIQATRQRRRDAKDSIDAMAPVCEWADMNRPTIKNLERLLGEVRKVERRQAGRAYVAMQEEKRKARADSPRSATAEYQREYRAKNHERMMAYQREYRERRKAERASVAVA